MDWKWTITAVLPVISLVLGAWLNQLSESRREEAALQREVKVRELDRTQARLERRESFELTHLAEASECLSRLYRAALITHVHRVNPETGSDEMQVYHQEAQEMDRLRGLILDDGLRDRVGLAMTHLSRMAWSDTDTAQQIGDSATLTSAVQEELALRLRKIYDTQSLHP